MSFAFKVIMKHESALVISLLCRLVGIGRQEGLFQVGTIKDSTDNRIENIQILCPNCHAQTDNYRGRNKSATRETL